LSGRGFTLLDGFLALSLGKELVKLVARTLELAGERVRVATKCDRCSAGLLLLDQRPAGRV
jgi:hypothetical protein